MAIGRTSRTKERPESAGQVTAELGPGRLESAGNPAPALSTLDRLERSQRKIWGSVLFLLVLLAAALALLSWETIRTLPHHLEALPIGLLVLVVLFGAYFWSRSQQMAELRGLIRGIKQRSAAPPSGEQLDQLFELITRSQRGYRDLIDTFDDLLFSVSLDGEIRAANRSLADLLGRPFSEIIGHRLDEFLDDPKGSARAAAEKALPQLLERRHWDGVVCVRLKQARAGPAVRYFDCVLHAMVKDARVFGIGGLARDITKLRENEARFTELFETLQEGVYFTTPEGKLLDANPALVRMLGYADKEELLGVSVNELCFDPSKRAIDAGGTNHPAGAQGQERTLRRKDGSAAICLDNSTAIRDATGRLVRYQGTLVDITQQREIEKRLHGEREFARRLVDSFPDLIVVLDTEARFTFVSPRITECLGYRPDELLGRNLGERSHPEDRPALLELFRELIAGKRAHGNMEYRTRHKQEGWRLLRASASPLFNEKGEIAGVIASARDVTQLRQLEQQVSQSEKLAAMGQMIAGVAHELNNPLTAILGVSELLLERATDDASRRQLDLAHRQARRAAHIVKSLLAFSRPPTPGKVRIHLGEVVQRTLQLHEQSLRANNISVEFHSESDHSAIMGDPNQLTQVFLNLVTNAEQAIREVRDRGTLRVRLARVGNHVVVDFQDDGVGISREALARIFDPFFTTKRPGGGAGLGLSICMAIIREHGGSIEAECLPSGGTSFTVSLPLVGEQAIDPSHPAGTMPHPESFSLQGVSVLLVDDEESIRELVQDGLSARGLVVDCASDGEQALALAARRSYDAVLCDINLASLRADSISGKEVFDRLAEGVAGAPSIQKPLFIFMTGDLVDSSTLEILGRGDTRVVQKPFRISDLVAILTEALQTTARSEPLLPGAA